MQVNSFTGPTTTKVAVTGSVRCDQGFRNGRVMRIGTTIAVASAMAVASMTVAAPASAAGSAFAASLSDGSTTLPVGEAQYSETATEAQIDITLNPRDKLVRPDPRPIAEPPIAVIEMVAVGQMKWTVDGKWALHVVDGLNKFPTVKAGTLITIRQGPVVIAQGTFRLTSSSAGAGQVPAAPARAGYCSVAGNTSPDGLPIPVGTFLNLLLGQPQVDANVAGAAPAAYVEGLGITCDPPPVGLSFDGVAFVDPTGVANNTPGAIYPFYKQG